MIFLDFFKSNVLNFFQVHHVGQPIGAIVADTQALAQRGAKLVQIQYEELEPIITIEVSSILILTL